MAHTPEPAKVRVAVTQAEPVWLDLKGSVEKTCRLIEEAAQKGAQLIAFPECWITGYPAWIWSRPVDFDLSVQYLENSIKVESPEMERVCACASSNNIVVVLGFSENFHNSAYIAQALISNDGRILIKRRKIKPTHMERTIFGDASGDSLKNVVDTNVGRVGMLACWEHAQPLLKYHTYLQREAIHVSAWPPVFEHQNGPGFWSMSREGCRSLSQVYAVESQSFVLHATAVLGKHGIDYMKTASGVLFNIPGGGSSAIFGPDGRQLSQDIPECEEGILYADLNLHEILKAKGFLDVCGHYSRPDMLWLGVDDDEKKHLQVRNKRPELQ
ncbi:carbon-nitrogen hydrolase [Crepidotus variabilis]|uniref:Carbon-nitrogen hydrolase n=1 Tax=Crepidotus variabilis TaxID=179855 RepID=A0A9P6JW37_9AGAR|nr:carbon-nitrogen hydrolase [Crepidotus variabilis]